MRGYFIPVRRRRGLAVSAFLPWVVVDGVSARACPTSPALWVAGLGALAAVLAMLSLITRKNSRHPLLVVGLAALGIMFLSWRIMPRLAGERALTVSQAFAIVENTPPGAAPTRSSAAASTSASRRRAVLVAFGLTIVIKRASQPPTSSLNLTTTWSSRPAHAYPHRRRHRHGDRAVVGRLRDTSARQPAREQLHVRRPRR